MKKQTLVQTINTVFAVTLPFTVLVACGGSPEKGVAFNPNAASIVKGQTVKAADPLSKMVVALVMQNDDGEALCTGSLIADDTVLTAAHCVEHNPQKIVVVFALNAKKSTPEQQRAATAAVQNPQWTSSGHSLGDLALIHFEGGLPEGFTPVTLATSTTKLASGEPVSMIGYGVTNGKTHAGAGVLRETRTTIRQMISTTQVLTDGETSSVCFGDSGGPSFTALGDTPVQWGVASAVTSDDCKTSSVHTSVMTYNSWIVKAAASLRR